MCQTLRVSIVALHLVKTNSPIVATTFGHIGSSILVVAAMRDVASAIRRPPMLLSVASRITLTSAPTAQPSRSLLRAHCRRHSQDERILSTTIRQSSRSPRSGVRFQPKSRTSSPRVSYAGKTCDCTEREGCVSSRSRTRPAISCAPEQQHTSREVLERNVCSLEAAVSLAEPPTHP